jgi:hypothetical protein
MTSDEWRVIKGETGAFVWPSGFSSFVLRLSSDIRYLPSAN